MSEAKLSTREKVIVVDAAYRLRCVSLDVVLECEAPVCLCKAIRDGNCELRDGDVIVSKLGGWNYRCYVRRFHKECYEAMRY